MAYDVNSFVQDFTLTGLANATLALAGAIRVPTHKGVRFAVIEDIQVTPTTAVVNTTTPMQIQVGTPTTTGKYAAQNVGTNAGLTVGSAYGIADVDGRVTLYNPSLTPSATVNGRIDLANDGDVVGTTLTTLKVSTLVGVGTPAGTVTAQITIRFW